LYWARALATQTEDTKLANHFIPIAESLSSSEEVIVRELHDDRGVSVNLGGYYHTEPTKTEVVMAPSETLKQILKTV